MSPARRCAWPASLLLLGIYGLSALFGAPLGAQERDLRWPEMVVTAHLDADGTLRVRERQVMQFTGDWNGGERRFDVRFGQQFVFDRLTRIDSVTGSEVELATGSLDDVDHFAVRNGNTVRWRSRMVDAPPFDSTRLTYVLSYHYRNILDVNRDGTYTLNHDFAFADREGELSRFALTLTLDSAWRAESGFTGHYEAGPLPAYQGYVVRVPLVRIGAGVPDAVRTGAPQSTRWLLLVLVLVGSAAVLAWVVHHAASRGQLASPPDQATITPAWLQEHVLVFPAEVVGAACEGRVGEAEVAATLARMVQEKKLSSSVTSEKVLLFERHVLHLTLNVDRNTLSGYEAALVDALFAHGSRHTDTDGVRERYKGSGFSPASVIRSGVMSRVRALAVDTDPRDLKQARRTRLLVIMTLALVALALLVGAFTRSTTDGGVTLAIMAATMLEMLVGIVVGVAFRDRVVGYGVSLAVLGFFVMELGAGATWLFVANPWRLGVLALAAVAVWVVTVILAIGAASCTTLSADRIALRQRLAGAKRWFESELAKPTPQLIDAWYPYLLALGLGRHVDKWFKDFGSEAAHTASTVALGGRTGSSSDSASGGTATFTGFGGGGGFSGGGGGSSFGAAVSSFASSVPSPSSSSSGGGSSSSSSSSSSGGGGGGGW